jgi:hypothetical protein
MACAVIVAAVARQVHLDLVDLGLAVVHHVPIGTAQPSPVPLDVALATNRDGNVVVELPYFRAVGVEISVSGDSVVDAGPTKLTFGVTDGPATGLRLNTAPPAPMDSATSARLIGREG